MKKLWYAVQIDSTDDWGNGSFDKQDAMRMMHEMNEELESNGFERTALIAVIDAGYDADGMPTHDGVCVEEITE